jgi:hypothetical protein
MSAQSATAQDASFCTPSIRHLRAGNANTAVLNADPDFLPPFAFDFMNESSDAVGS